MAAPTLPAPVAGADTDDLASMGYPQELHRRLGWFASFAAGFSFVSILTTVFQLFPFGFGFAGPAFFWTWPVVFGGQLCVALVFAELSARFPIAGCIYQWSRRTGGSLVGWFAGWFMVIGYVISVAAISLALQAVLPSIWDGFQVVGGDPSVTTLSGATNAIVLGTVLIAVCTVISIVGVHVMSTINVVGVTCELVGVVLLLALLFSHTERGPQVVMDTGGTGSGLGYVGPLLVSALMAAYVMYGFDSAAELSEETKDPRGTAPKAILRALWVSAIGGGLMLLAVLMAAPSVSDGELASGGIPYVVESQLGTGLGKALLVDVAVAIVSATLAIQNSASRVMFSMARDGRLPFSHGLSRVNPRTGTPVVTGIAVSGLAAAVLLVNLGNAQLFTAVTGVAVVIVYLAYLFVTVPALVERLRGRLPAAEPGRFSLGRWGIPLNVVAVLYGGFMTVNLAWPRSEVYDPEGGHWYLQWFAVLFLAVAGVLGAVAHARLRHAEAPAVRRAALADAA